MSKQQSKDELRLPKIPSQRPTITGTAQQSLEMSRSDPILVPRNEQAER
jgi:hypothetical protein